MTKSVFTGEYERLRAMLVEGRKAAGVSQAELASRLSQTQSYVSKYERGERRLDVIEFFDVAAALDLEPIEFLRRLRAQSAPKKPGKRR